MIIYLKSNGGRPTPAELGLKDFYHDKDGKYDGDPIFIPAEYKGNEMQYFVNRNKEKNNGEYIADPPKYDSKQEYHLEKEAAADNLSWGRNHYSARVYENQKYEAWLNNWN